MDLGDGFSAVACGHDLVALRFQGNAERFDNDCVVVNNEYFLPFLTGVCDLDGRRGQQGNLGGAGWLLRLKSMPKRCAAKGEMPIGRYPEFDIGVFMGSCPCPAEVKAALPSRFLSFVGSIYSFSE